MCEQAYPESWRELRLDGYTGALVRVQRRPGELEQSVSQRQDTVMSTECFDVEINDLAFWFSVQMG